MLKTFLEVTAEANAAWTGSDEQIAKVAKDAGMDVPTTTAQMADFIFPTSQEQLEKYFGEGGIAAEAAASLGVVFSADSDGVTIAKTIDGSFLK